MTKARADDEARTVFAQRTFSAVRGKVLFCDVCASSRSSRVFVEGDGERERGGVLDREVKVPMNVWISFIGGSAKEKGN